MIKKCETCSFEFETKRTHKYCSDKCNPNKYVAKPPQEKTCDVCGEKYFPKKNDTTSKRCSQECSDKINAIRVKEWRENIFVEKTKNKECEICGGCFVARGKTIQRKTCSDKCSEELHKRNNKINEDLRTKENRAKYKKIECKECGVLFMPLFDRNIFCSKKCKNEKFVRKSVAFKKNREEKKAETAKNKKLRRNERLKQPEYRTKNSVSRMMRVHMIHNSGKTKMGFLPYTIKELNCHLEDKFEDWMTWNNYGVYKIGGERKWTLEHIIAQTYFKFVNEDGSMNIKEIQMCWSLKNLEPKCFQENTKKSNKITPAALELAKEFGINLEERAKELGLKYELISDIELMEGGRNGM